MQKLGNPMTQFGTLSPMMATQSIRIAVLFASFAALACDADDEPVHMRAGAAAQQLGVSEYRGDHDDVAATYELLDEAGAVVGTYHWETTQVGEATEIDFGEHVYEMNVAYSGEWIVVVDGRDVASFDFASPGPANRIDGPDAVLVDEALHVFSATQQDLQTGSFAPATDGETEYGIRVCVGGTLFGVTYEYCFEVSPPSCYVHEAFNGCES